ncbi:hypothetical protein C8J57DRAFT_1462339 [Mycena rebaudengoi]|nr:hypothetical protein C8J57DRAFT_1462339 [Mycena rebaudengoi]
MVFTSTTRYKPTPHYTAQSRRIEGEPMSDEWPYHRGRSGGVGEGKNASVKRDGGNECELWIKKKKRKLTLLVPNDGTTKKRRDLEDGAASRLVLAKTGHAKPQERERSQAGLGIAGNAGPEEREAERWWGKKERWVVISDRDEKIIKSEPRRQSTSERGRLGGPTRASGRRRGSPGDAGCYLGMAALQSSTESLGNYRVLPRRSLRDKSHAGKLGCGTQPSAFLYSVKVWELGEPATAHGGKITAHIGG